MLNKTWFRSCKIGGISTKTKTLRILALTCYLDRNSTVLVQQCDQDFRLYFNEKSRLRFNTQTAFLGEGGLFCFFSFFQYCSQMLARFAQLLHVGLAGLAEQFGTFL